MSIPIKDVVAITGAPGLYQVVKADDKAIVVESIDAQRKRQMIKGNMMVSKLVDISIYTTQDSEPLQTILQNIHAKYGKELPVTKKSSGKALLEFLESVLPDYDEERVYASNVKKLVAWYKILMEYEVDLSSEEEDGTESSEEDKTSESEE